MKILLAGCTGFIGKSLILELLKKGHSLILLSRDPSKITARPSLSILPWDGKTTDLWSRSAEGVDAVINLSGEGIADKRWSNARKKALVDSRVHSTQAIVQFIHHASKKPAVFINASAVGFYGNVPQGDVTETHPKGNGFLADTCAAWEQEALAAEGTGTRTVLLRIGIVLERGGGALSKMLFPFKIFAGGPLGSGKQWFPWIHRDDVVGAVLFALENSSLSGPVNLAAPQALTMGEFCKALGKVISRPSWAPVPGFMLKLILGEMADMLLGGQKAVPGKLLASGYTFKYPDIQSALCAALL